MRLIDADDIDNHIVGHVDTRTCPTINAIPIPENITNGDMIKLLFPNKYGEEYGRTKVYYCIDAHNRMEFQIDWWNKPYKEEK